MHAILIVTKMDTQQYDRQRRELEERIVPFVKNQPGFVSGTWLYDRDGGSASSMLVFDSADNARRLGDIVRQQIADPSARDSGVQFESIVVGEVQAQARR